MAGFRERSDRLADDRRQAEQQRADAEQFCRIGFRMGTFGAAITDV